MWAETKGPLGGRNTQGRGDGRMTTTPTVTLAEVVADLVAQTLPRCTPPLAQRLERAAIIALTAYAIHSAGDTVAVHCLQDWGTVYLVRGPECTCLDFAHRGGPCKHSLA